MRFAAAAFALFLAGCGNSPDTKTEAPAAAVKPVVKDDTRMLPQTGLSNARVVPDHLLDLPKMPGGTLGDYNVARKHYQLFIIETPSNQDAALLLLELKGALVSPEYISYMGGYYGKQGTTPVYAFAKLKYLAGVVGLAKDDADPIARVLASRLK